MTVRARINNEYVDFIAEIKDAVSEAPGAVSSGWDLWSAPHTSDHYFGMLIMWVDVDWRSGTWTLRDEVAACRKMLGKHDGENLGKYLLLCYDRVGVTSKEGHKVSMLRSFPIPMLKIFTQLGHITNDNAQVNFTAGTELEKRLDRRKIQGNWNADWSQLGYVLGGRALRHTHAHFVNIIAVSGMLYSWAARLSCQRSRRQPWLHHLVYHCCNTNR